VGETFDIGADTGTPVDDKDSQVPFRFTGKLNKLTVQVGPMQLAPPEKKEIQKKIGERDSRDPARRAAPSRAARLLQTQAVVLSWVDRSSGKTAVYSIRKGECCRSGGSFHRHPCRPIS
jgi:hypothetical protein